MPGSRGEARPRQAPCCGRPAFARNPGRRRRRAGERPSDRPVGSDSVTEQIVRSVQADQQIATGVPWWRGAVTYQVYIRSFADGERRRRRRHRRDPVPAAVPGELGVDAIWINPWYPSPMADAGYDVADYRDVDPLFGTLDEAVALIARGARARVCGCCSTSSRTTPPTQHPWFRGGARRRRPARRRGPASCSGPAAAPTARGRRTTGSRRLRRAGLAAGHRAGRPPGEWYLHLFAPEQPDLDWTNPEVREEFEDILRFWFDRGVDGFRIDVAHGAGQGPADGPGATRRPSRVDSTAAAPAPRRTRSGTGTGCTTSTARGGASPTPTTPPRVFVAEAWVREPGAARALPAPRRAAHRLQLPLPARAVGRAARCGGRSTTRLRAHERGRRARRPGCCPTTTSPGT